MKPKILIDTNLLMLLAVGMYRKDYISSHKRTVIFTEEDFDILEILTQGHELIVTANVLTEASNMLWSGADQHKNGIREALKTIIESSTEHLLQSSELCQHPYFMKLGLTDAGILALKDEAGIILTQDLDLHLAALEHGLHSENFTHYRNL